jgi:soluble lytic murein transglycosylase-like protein
MKKTILYILILIAVGEIVALVVMKKSKPEVLSQSVAATLFPTPAQTPELSLVEISSTPPSSPSPAPTPTPVAVNTVAPAPVQPLFTSQEIYGFIERFSAQYGVDPNVIRHIAVCESGFNPAAHNLDYAGLFQFGPSAWKNWRVKMGEDVAPELRFNAEEAVQTAAFAFKEGGKSLWPNCTP